MITRLSLPSPDQGVWHLGPIPARAYALCIIAGIVAALWVAQRRWAKRGGDPNAMQDIALWCVPLGIVGGRLYHVATDPQLYFAPGRDPWRAFYVWEGGLGIWGAIALGAVGAWIAARRSGLRMSDIAGTLAPAIPLAQAIGRWGNWFNQELFGRPTDLPWGLQISPDNRPEGFADSSTFHPAFLYESLWDLGVVGFVLWVERRYNIAGGRLFAVYVMAYTTGRAWIEALRIDTVNHVLGLRLNVWVSILVFAGAAIHFVLAGRSPRSTRDGRGSDRSDPASAGLSGRDGLNDQ
jgi:prolipoprotein diacylglyceryl transferase